MLMENKGETMKIVISKESLVDVLSSAEKFVSKSDVNPVLGCVVIKAKGENIEVISSDMEKGIRVIEKAEIKEEGEIALNFKKLFSSIKELPSKNDITISYSTERATVVSGKSKFTLPVINPGEFPAIDFDCKRGDTVKVTEKDIKDIFLYGSFCFLDKDTSKPMFAGVYFQTKDDTLITASSDTKRLAEYSVKCNGSLTNGIIVPHPTLISVNGIVKEDEREVTIKTNHNMVFFNIGNKTVCSRLIASKYPDYKQMIPKNKNKATFSYSELSSAIRQVIPFTTLDIFGISFKMKEEVCCVSVRTETGEAEVKVPVDLQGIKEYNVIIDSRFIQEALRVIKSESVIFEIVETGMNPVVIKDMNVKGFQNIIMPIKG